jgi:hydroxyacylglutathione hydrolase
MKKAFLSTSISKSWHLLMIGLIVFAGGPVLAEEQEEIAEKAKPSIEVTRIEVKVGEEPNAFTENVYIVVNQQSKDAIIIDPGSRDERIDSFVEAHGLRVRTILNTHGHHDHCGANQYYAEKFKVAVAAHDEDAPFYTGDQKKQKPGSFFDNKEQLAVPGFEVKVFHTPGHSPGSVCYLINGILISGDTLFRESVGRTWGKTEEEKQEKTAQMVAAIKKYLLPLPEDTVVYPGHGASSTIGYEKKNNPFLQ